MSRRAHHPHTPRRQRPLRQMVQRLPTAHPVHHLGAGTDHHSRQYHDLRAKNKARQRRNANTYRTYRPPVERAISGSPATKPDAYPTEG